MAGLAAGIGGAALGAAAQTAFSAIFKADRAQLLIHEPKPTGATPDRLSPMPYETIPFTFNPKDYDFGRKVETTQPTAPGAQASPQLIGPLPRTFKFEILFDRLDLDLASPGLKDLTKIAELLSSLCVPHPSTVGSGKNPCLPILQFRWGKLETGLALASAVSLKYEFFLPGGLPMRLRTTIDIQEIDTRVARQNPTSGSDTVTKSHTLLRGESLASIAYKEYSDAACWRAIAERNGIDDPLRVRPGTFLLLPPLDEAMSGR